jgi:hypothetical protein
MVKANPFASQGDCLKSQVGTRHVVSAIFNDYNIFGLDHRFGHEDTNLKKRCCPKIIRSLKSNIGAWPFPMRQKNC